METIKGLQYKIEISDSVLDHIHGFKHLITETFVPELNIIFNEGGGIFHADKPRNNSTGNKLEYWEVVINKKDIKEMKRYLELKDKVFSIVNKYYPMCKKLI